MVHDLCNIHGTNIITTGSSNKFVPPLNLYIVGLLYGIDCVIVQLRFLSFINGFMVVLFDETLLYLNLIVMIGHFCCILDLLLPLVSLMTMYNVVNWDVATGIKSSL